MTRVRPEKGYYQWLSCGTLLDAFDVEENSCLSLDSQGVYEVERLVDRRRRKVFFKSNFVQNLCTSHMRIMKLYLYFVTIPGKS